MTSKTNQAKPGVRIRHRRDRPASCSAADLAGAGRVFASERHDSG